MPPVCYYPSGFANHLIQATQQRGINLGTCASEAELLAFEEAHHCKIPQEYRWFLLNCGNGSSGSGKGIIKLENALSLFLPDIDGEFAEPGKLFPHSTYLRMLGLPDESLSVEAEGITEEDDDFIDLIDGGLQQNAGYLSLANITGTNLHTERYILILNGPRQGEVWRATLPFGPIQPLDLQEGYSPTFLAWIQQWLELGPAPENVQDYPRPPILEPVPQRVRVVFGGYEVADTIRALRILETHHAPTYYIPGDDIDGDLLIPNSHRSFCEWKGNAEYYDMEWCGKKATNAAWFYREPRSAFNGLRNHIAFYPELMDACYIGDMKVVPQEGDFFGGWITPNLTGRIKDQRGTK